MPADQSEGPRSNPASGALVWLGLVVLVGGWVLTLFLATQTFCSTPFCHQTLGRVILGSVVAQIAFIVYAVVLALRRRPKWWTWGYAGLLASTLLVAWIGHEIHWSLQRRNEPVGPSSVLISATNGRELSEPTELLDVSVGGPGLGVIGGSPNSGLWVSTDGAGWKGTASGALGGAADLRALAPWRQGLMAGGEETGAAVIWRSADGYAWDRIGGGRDDLLWSGRISGLVEWNGAILATGGSDYDRRGYKASVWLQVGKAWELTQLTDTQGSLESVDTFDGLLIAVGHYTDATFDLFGMIWLSSDGRSWEQAVDLGQLTGVQLLDLTRGPNGFVTVGTVISAIEDDDENFQQFDPFVMRSVGGQLWEKVTVTLPAEGGLDGVATSDDGVVAVGWAGPSELDIHGLILFSEDGRIWSPATITSSVELGQLNAVTYTGESWVAVGKARGNRCECAVLQSKDGLTWSDVSR